MAMIAACGDGTGPNTRPAPRISLSASSAAFAATVGGANPSAQGITITNSGTGTLSDLTASVSYQAGQPTGWLSAPLGAVTAPATLTLTPTVGALAAGTYNATVTVASIARRVTNSPQLISVTLTVTAAPTIALSASSASFSAMAGGANPAPQGINITNSGTGTLTGLTASVNYQAGQPTGWLSAPLGAATAPTAITLTPTVGALAAGTYNAIVSVASSASRVTNSPQLISVTFTVTATPTIALSASSAAFAATVGGANPPPQGITITNSGTGALSGLTASVSYQAGQPTGWLSVPLGAVTAPTTLTLTPSVGALAAGTYNATVAVASSASGVLNSPQLISVTFTVTATPTIALSASSAAFSATAGGANPAPQGINITNSGTGTLSGLTTSVSYQAGQPTGWLSAPLAAVTAPTTLTVTPTVGLLTAGTYNATVTIASSASGVTNSPQDIAVALTVAPAAPQFSQQGPKLVGSGVVGGFASQGSSVSISADGNTAIVGGPADNNEIGAAWIWTRTGGVWTQEGGKLVGTGAVNLPYRAKQGTAVAISADGNTAIVGGGLDSAGLGAAWIWTRTGGVWTQEGGKLVGTGSVGSLVYQGSSVALSSDGNTAIVGGVGDNGSVGAVWIWTRSGGVWTQQGAKLVGTGSVGTFIYQGSSVSLSADGNTALVGGHGDNFSIGAAWVWTRSGGVWTQEGAKLVGTGGVGLNQQGFSVSLSADGNTALVGAPSDNIYVGATWVWTRFGGVWTQLGNKLVGTGGVGGINGGSNQGISVSLSADGNTAIVGGPQDNNLIGAAWIWRRSGNTWTQLGTKLVGTGRVGPTNYQGQSVSISADGTTVIVGGPNDNIPLGAAWVYSSP